MRSCNMWLISERQKRRKILPFISHLPVYKIPHAIICVALQSSLEYSLMGTYALHSQITDYTC
jgi:hypothetical protein